MPHRRWPLLLALLTLAVCLGIAWRIHEQGRPIEEAYARIQAGMTTDEVDAILDPVRERPRLPSIVLFDWRLSERSISRTCTLRHGYVVVVEYVDDTEYPDTSVMKAERAIGKTIHRPDWSERVKFWLQIEEAATPMTVPVLPSK